MRDPDRLLRKPSTQLSLLLLQAGAEEKPSARARSRTAQSVAAAAGIATTSTSTSAAATAGGAKLTATNASALAGGAPSMTGGAAVPAGAKLGLAVLAKWFGIGALGGVLAVPVVHAVDSARRATPPHESPALVAGGAAANRSESRTVPSHAAPEAVASAPVNALELQAGLEARGGPGAVSPPTPAGTMEGPASTDGSFLAIEVRFVEQGRTALQRGAFAEALARLASYEDRFPKQQLLTEVLFLRMEAFSRSGDAPRARSLAALIITRDVAGPQAARAREVLGR